MRLFFFLDNLFDIFKGCTDVVIECADGSRRGHVIKDDMVYIEFFSQGKCGTTGTYRQAYEEFLSTAFVLLDRKNVYETVTQYFHNYEQSADVLESARNNLVTVISVDCGDYPTVEKMSGTPKTCSMIRDPRGINVQRLVEYKQKYCPLADLRPYKSYVVSDWYVVESIDESKTLVSFKDTLDNGRLRPVNDTFAVYTFKLYGARTSRFSTAAVIYNGTYQTNVGVPVYQAVIIRVPGQEKDLRKMLQYAIEYEEPANEVSEALQESITLSDLKALNEDFLDDIDTKELERPTETISKREVNDYEFTMGIALEYNGSPALRSEIVKQRVEKFLGTSMYLKDYSDVIINMKNYPEGKYDFRKGYNCDEPIVFGFDSNFKRVKDIALWLLSLYRFIHPKLGKLRITITDNEYGGDVRFYRFATLRNIVEKQATNTHIENMRDFLQVMIGLTEVCEMLLGSSNLVAQMYRTFPIFDPSEYFRAMVREKLGDWKQAKIKDVEVMDTNMVFETRDEFLELLRIAEFYTTKPDWVKSKHYWLSYNTTNEVEVEDRVHKFAALIYPDDPVRVWKIELGNMWVQGEVFWRYITLTLWPSEVVDNPVWVSVTFVVDVTQEDKDEPFEKIKDLLLKK